MEATKQTFEEVKLPASWVGKHYMLGAIGIALVCVSAILFYVLGPSRSEGFKLLLHSYLANFIYILSFGIGAMFFVLITHLTRASWCATIRRWAELISMTIPFTGVLFIPILLMVLTDRATPLYSWNQPIKLIGEQIVQKKVDYLNGGFFTARAVICLLIWSAIVSYYYRLSRRQDETGGVELSTMRQRYAGPLIMIFSLTVSMASFDWVMSIDPDWYSTIFGVYLFSASMFGFFAFMIVSLHLLQKGGKLNNEVNIEHFHDMGKFLFGFTMFWSYIAFSQLLLYWYGNIPEETAWFKDRLKGGWEILTYGSIFIHFIIPFLGLMSRHVRRNRFALVFFAVWALVAHWLDMTFLVMPNTGPSTSLLWIAHILGGIGVSSMFLGLLLARATDVPLLASRDPLIPESLSYANPIL